MGRKKKHPEHPNHDRWLVSYADFITLLFAFFVVMFAVSQVDDRKVGRFTESVQAATRWGMFDKSPPPGVLQGGSGITKAKQRAEPAPRSRGKRGSKQVALLRAQLEPMLREAIRQGRILLVESEGGLIVRLREAAFFPSGSAELQEANTGELRALGEWIKDLPNPVRIEGHTDSRPIRTSRYRSNWDLSAARASTVLQVLSGESGVAEERLSVAGYADRQPVASNDTEEGRRQNRRVDVVLVEQAGSRPTETRWAPPEPHPQGI